MFLFAGLCVCIDLLPPHQFTNLSEIGNWTLRGSASNMKHYIRLTSGTSHQTGSICLRVPTRARDWELQIDVSLQTGSLPGDGLFLYFTQEVCPAFRSRINGFALWLRTERITTTGRVPIVFMEGTGADDPRTEIGTTTVDHPFTLHISKVNDHLTVATSRDFEYEPVGSLNKTDFLNYGYFTIHGDSHPQMDVVDVVAVRFNAMHDMMAGKYAPQRKTDFSGINRRFIEREKATRRLRKLTRRAAMEITFETVKTKRDRLDGASVDLKDALRIVAEAHGRAQHNIAEQRLTQLIRGPLVKTIELMYKKVKFAARKFEETSELLTEMWSALKTSLLDLAVETQTDLDRMKEEFVEAVQQLNLAQVNTVAIKKALKKEAADMSDASLTLLLAAVAYVEVVIFVIFFCIKRSKTHGFKKLD
jgi:mannose-binding lectin 1